MMSKALSIAGGGERGAITVGRLSERDEVYSIGDGVSTGSLMLQLSILNKWDTLIKAYTSVTTSDITEVSAFRGEKFRILHALYRTSASFFGGKLSFGDSENLLQLIDKFNTYEDWLDLHSQGKTIYVSAYSLRYLENVQFSSKEYRDHFDEFKKRIWVSANAPFVMSLAEFPRHPWSDPSVKEQWTDSGVVDKYNSEHLNEEPRELLREKPEVINLFLHESKPKKVDKGRVNNILKYVFRILWNVPRGEMSKGDLREIVKDTKLLNIPLQVHYIPEEYVQDNAFTFNEDYMKELLKVGKEIAYDSKYIAEYNT